mgnify:CR=1 FL=1
MTRCKLFVSNWSGPLAAALQIQFPSGSYISHGSLYTGVADSTIISFLFVREIQRLADLGIPASVMCADGKEEDDFAHIRIGQR